MHHPTQLSSASSFVYLMEGEAQLGHPGPVGQLPGPLGRQGGLITADQVVQFTIKQIQNILIYCCLMMEPVLQVPERG